MQQNRYIAASTAVLSAVLLLAVYWTGLHGSFFFDDGPSILTVPGVKLQALSMESLHQAWLSGGAGPTGRPVAQLSFALNYYFSGFNPFAFKATNLAIHWVCGGLVFALALHLLRAGQPQPKPQHAQVAASAVALLWLLHPMQLLPVLHVVQRMTSLSALFLLTALWLHVRGRQGQGRAGVVQLIVAWAIFWPLSLLSKESGALFPLFALAWELTLRRSAHGGLDRFGRVFAALSALVLMATLVYLFSPRAQWLWAGYEQRGFSLPERLLTEGRVLWLYLGLIVWPRLSAFGLYHDDIALSTGLLTPWTTLPAWLALAGLSWLVWHLRKRAPLLAFGIAWFLIGHVLESTALPLEIAHEHRNYLPLFGPAMLAGYSLLQALQQSARYDRPALVVAATGLATLALITALRSQQFGDDLQRTLIEAEHHPASSRAQHAAGVALDDLPQAAMPQSKIFALARQRYQSALALDPAFKMGLLGLIQLNCKAALPVEPDDLQELARRLRETPFAPGDRTVLYNLKEMSISGPPCLSRTDVASLFAAALANPGVSSGVQSMLHSWHADYLWLHERDMAAARQALGQSLALNPGNPSNRLKWAQLLLISGEKAQAGKLLLELADESFPAEERQTIQELLAALKIQ